MDNAEYVVELDENDTEAHYEVGFAFYKLKDSEGFNKQYAELRDLDEAKAGQLLDNTYKPVPKQAKIIVAPVALVGSVTIFPKQSNK